jgi:hypothetical protein
MGINSINELAEYVQFNSLNQILIVDIKLYWN